MKLLKFASLVILIASFGALAVCLFTDWNDKLYLPMATCLCLAGNWLNLLSERKGRGEREKIK